MPNPRILAFMFLPLAEGALGAPPVPPPQAPQLSQQAPVRPCLVNATRCLSLAPQPFRPCLATLSCGDHFGFTPVNDPVLVPAALRPPR